MYNIYTYISSFIYDYPGRNKYFVSLHFFSNWPWLQASSGQTEHHQ